MRVKELPFSCPVCDSRLEVRELFCPSCSIKIQGSFPIHPFLELNKQELDFLFLFLKTRGNLSEVSKILGISYPTIRLRFEEFLKKIGIEPVYSSDEISEILELLENGEITPLEAEKRIRKIKRI